MSKPSAKATKSYRAGHIKVRVTASASHRGEDVSASVAVDLDLETARKLHADIWLAIEKEATKIKAHEEREARRKAWRDREVAAGRMKIISLSHL